MANQDILQHRNYRMIAENNIENIRGDIWDWEFVQWPAAVYNPGETLFKTRLISIDPGSDVQPQLISKTVNGHDVSSPGGRAGQPVDVTYGFNDREDQAITYFVQDYMNQSGDPDTGFGRHKLELLWIGNVLIYNTLLQPIRKIEYYAGLYNGSSIPDNIGDHGSDLSAVSLTIHFEHHKRFLL